MEDALAAMSEALQRAVASLEQLPGRVAVAAHAKAIESTVAALISACEEGQFSACEKDHQAEKAMELGVEMQQRGLEPNGSTVAALISACEEGQISACEKDHQVEKAMELGVEMQQRGLEPNGSTVTALISACEKGQISACEKGLTRPASGMCIENDNASSRCIENDNGQISACEKEHQVEKAMELGVEMQQRGLEQKWNCLQKWNSMQVEKAMELFAEMQKCDMSSYIAVSACEK